MGWFQLTWIVSFSLGSFGHFQASKSGVHKGGLHVPLVKAGFVATRISVSSSSPGHVSVRWGLNCGIAGLHSWFFSQLYAIIKSNNWVKKLPLGSCLHLNDFSPSVRVLSFRNTLGNYFHSIYIHIYPYMSHVLYCDIPLHVRFFGLVQVDVAYICSRKLTKILFSSLWDLFFVYVLGPLPTTGSSVFLSIIVCSEC